MLKTSKLLYIFISIPCDLVGTEVVGSNTTLEESDQVCNLTNKIWRIFMIYE